MGLLLLLFMFVEGIVICLSAIGYVQQFTEYDRHITAPQIEKADNDLLQNSRYLEPVVSVRLRRH
jgi:hypothetical protein